MILPASKACVVNFGKNAWYPVGQERLVSSLKAVGWDGDVLTFCDESEIGAPPHQVAPYAFKPFALKRAVELGYDQVLWADCSVWAIKPIAPMFEHIRRHGHMLFNNVVAGHYSSDASLKSFGITREESFKIDMLMGICMGWDMTTPKCQEFLKEWLEKAVDGVTFPGSWTNKNHEVSDDPRVFGHRHDQTAATYIAHRLGMELIVGHHTYFQYYENPAKVAYAINQDMSMMNHGVVMVAQGM